MNNESLQLSTNRNYLGCNMPWSEQQILSFQMDNKQHLEEINKTLSGLTGKPIVGIFAPGQNGDAMTASSCLKYKDHLWPKKDIVWFCNYPVAEFLMYNKEVAEVRPWPWGGNGLPEGSEDFWPMLCNEKDNQLNQNLKYNFNLTRDLTDGYFPVPWMLTPEQRHGIEYPNISKKVFGIPDNYEWHPVLFFSDEERRAAIEFINKVGDGEKIIIESMAGSGQSRLNEEMIAATMNICSEYWPGCKFIFASNKFLKDNETFPVYLFEQPDVFSCAHFTVRECALISDQCDLMISVSSGITVAASAWGIRQPPTLQFTGSDICSTQALAHTQFELVTADDKEFKVAKDEYYFKLMKLLNQHSNE